MRKEPRQMSNIGDWIYSDKVCNELYGPTDHKTKGSYQAMFNLIQVWHCTVQAEPSVFSKASRRFPVNIIILFIVKEKQIIQGISSLFSIRLLLQIIASHATFILGMQTTILTTICTVNMSWPCWRNFGPIY